MQAQDLDVFFEDDSVPCEVVGFPEFRGLRWSPERALDFGDQEMIACDAAVWVKSSDVALCSIKRGVAITVDAVGYVVAKVLKLDDGALSRVLLQKP